MVLLVKLSLLSLPCDHFRTVEQVDGVFSLLLLAKCCCKSSQVGVLGTDEHSLPSKTLLLVSKSSCDLSRRRNLV